MPFESSYSRGAGFEIVWTCRCLQGICEESGSKSSQNVALRGQGRHKTAFGGTHADCHKILHWRRGPQSSPIFACGGPDLPKICVWRVDVVIDLINKISSKFICREKEGEAKPPNSIKKLPNELTPSQPPKHWTRLKHHGSEGRRSHQLASKTA